MSIEGTPPVNFPPANDALLLAAGRLADLYMLLGNEAFADASDPTIAFGTDDGQFGAEASSIHCFMNQTASLIDEELALLRGRDDQLPPGVGFHPFYNRLIWNFTRDITGGEVAYALNYNVRDEQGAVDGQINEADAKRLYPQGHGDAWGHYLMAIKNYYRLLRSPNFTWVPRTEAVLVGGVPVAVDFLDERKFAKAAAAKARTGAEITSPTYSAFAGAQNTNQKYLVEVRYGPGGPALSPSNGPPWQNFHFARLEYDDFLRLCENQNPSMGETLTQRLNTTRMEDGENAADRRIFYDFTFSPPKSVSLAGFLGKDERILEAHARSVRSALRERVLADVRDTLRSIGPPVLAESRTVFG